MPSPLLRFAVLAAGLPLLAGAATAGTALAGTAATAGTAARVVPAAARGGAPPPGAVLTLINGDRLLTGQAGDGRRSSVVLRAPGSGLARSLVTLGLGSRKLLIPLAALPFVGRGLDPRLFDVGALQRAERNGRLPVTIRSRGLAPALPGVTVTSRAKGIEQGYFTASSARAFGAALVRQMTRDHARGSYGTDGLFAGGVSVSLPGAAPARARPHFPMHTLTVTATSSAGKADTGDDVEVFNVSKPHASGDSLWLNGFYHGATKFSVPSGTYWALGFFVQLVDHGRSAIVRMDVLPQFTVAGNTTVRMRARAATSKVTMVTPRPAEAQSLELDLIRSSRGAVEFMGAGTGTDSSLWVNPISRRPSEGTLQAYTGGLLTSPPGRGVPYAYALNFANPPGIIPPQHFVARAASLATVSERYYQDVPSQGAWTIMGGPAALWEHSILEGEVLPLRMPARQVQYLSAGPAMLWRRQYWEFGDALAGGQADTLRVLHPGQHLTEQWGAYPLHTAPNVSLPGAGLFLTVPSAVRAGNKLILDTTPFSDNLRGHTGTGFANGTFRAVGRVAGSYALFQDGKKIAGGDAVKAAGGSPALGIEAALKPRPSAIRFVVTASRTGKQYTLSTRITDAWTWRSRPDPAAIVPAPWLCGFTPSGQPVRRCAVQPMLTLRYHVAGLGLAGTAPGGRQVLDLTADHLQLAAQSRITRAEVRVSVNGGRTWQRAAVLATGPGRFRAMFTAPRAHDVTLQVIARDAAGDSVTETIRGAYRTSA